MNVRLTIDRLVIDGIDVAAADRPRLQRAVESELARLITRDGIHGELASGIAVPSISVPAIGVGAAPTPQRLGNAIASSVHDGIGGRRS
jgi:hypothetical protein